MSIQIDSASAQLCTVFNMPGTGNLSGITLTAWGLLLDSDVTHMAIDISTGASSGTRAGIQVGAGGVFRGQARSSDGDSLHTVGTPAGIMPIGPWTFMVCIIDYPADSITLYLGNGTGITVASFFGAIGFAATQTSNTVSQQTALGADANLTTDSWNGFLEDIRVYNRVLSLQEVQTINACRGRDGLSNGMIHQYRFNEKGPGALVTSVPDYGTDPQGADGVNSPLYSGNSILAFGRPEPYAIAPQR